jgi:nitrogen regulatory protein P-II 1
VRGGLKGAASMKKIECYIQPYNLDAVAEALAVEGVVGMSVGEVKGFGVEKGFTRGEDVSPGQYRFHPKMKVEMVVLEKDVERIIKALTDSLKSNMIGEGKIFVLPIDDAVRTRTGERGRDAIT